MKCELDRNRAIFVDPEAFRYLLGHPNRLRLRQLESFFGDLERIFIRRNKPDPAFGQLAPKARNCPRTHTELVEKGHGQYACVQLSPQLNVGVGREFELYPHRPNIVRLDAAR